MGISQNPRFPDTLYANTTQGALRSDDGGLTWALFPRNSGKNLKVQHMVRVADLNPTDNKIIPFFQIQNYGTVSVPLSELKIRYYYTRDGGASQQQFWVDYALVGNNNVTGTFGTHGAFGADTLTEVGFTAGAGSVAPGGTSGEIQTRWNKVDWSNYNESNDYSYNPALTSYADWSRATLFRNGERIWGYVP